jgi:8-oxo-dGTP diphosphatase
MRVVAAWLWAGPRAVWVQQRRLDGPRGGLWEFPGGKVEAAESDAAALARELREELGIETQVGAELDVSVHRYQDLTVELHLLEARVVQGTPVALSAESVRAVDIDELSQLSFSAADVPFVQRCSKWATR